MRDLKASSNVPTRLLVRIMIPKWKVSQNSDNHWGFLQWNKSIYTVIIFEDPQKD